MHIAFLTPEYPHAKTGSAGGIGTSIQNLAESLMALGHQVRILVYGQKVDAIFEQDGIVIQQIKNVKIKGLSWYLTRKKLERIINDLYDKQLIDIVEAPDWTGITSFIQPKKCPVVIKLHGSDTYFCHLDQRPVKWWNRFHEKRALQKADGHISVSRFTAEMTNELFGLQLRFAIIPNGINPEKFQPDPSITKVPDTILYFGTLIRKKGLLELPLIFNAVVAKNPKAQLFLVGRDAFDIQTGSASTWQLMQALFTPEALQQVHYMGGVPYADVRMHIAQAAVCVFPSFAEALPVSWLEAMAMEKAIVASNIGWASEVIASGKEGILVHSKDHEAYAHAILDVLEDDHQNTTFGKKAAQKIQAVFANNLIAMQSVTFYQTIIANKK